MNRILCAFHVFLILGTEQILGCSPASNEAAEHIQADVHWSLLLNAISLMLVSASFYLYYKKGKKGLIISIVGALILAWGFYLGEFNAGSDCGRSAIGWAEWNILITFGVFSIQLFTWLFTRQNR